MGKDKHSTKNMGSKEKNDCLTYSEGCGRCIVVAVCILFMVIGLLMVIAGSFVLADGPMLVQIINQTLAGYQTEDLRFDADSLKVSEILGGAAIGILVSGLLILIITILGCGGGCFGCFLNGCNYLLIPYVIILGLLIIGQIVLAVLLFMDPRPFDNALRTYLYQSIDYFEGIRGNNSVSLLWNAAMFEMQCCGVNDFNDFYPIRRWVNPITYKGIKIQLQCPIACCKEIDDMVLCARSPGTGNNNRFVGCYDKFWDDVFLTSANRPIAYGVATATLVVQAIILTMTIVVLCTFKKNKVGPKPMH